MASPSNSGTHDQVRSWIPVIVMSISSIVTVTLWLQNQGDSKYFSKESGENLKEKLADVKMDMQQVKQQNMEIIQRLAAIDARMSQGAK